jgi:hypothetical protein
MLGMFFWLLWFAAISGVAISVTDNYLKNRWLWLKSSAMGLTAGILAIGLIWGFSVFALSTSSKLNVLGDYSKMAADSLKDIFSYNDVTGLWQQAGENLLQGKNPYAEANIVTASIKYNIPAIQITPLRKGIFADVFPYPNPYELSSFWDEAKRHPDVVPVEVESRYGYPAGSFLILIPFLLVGVQDIRIIFSFLVFVSIAIVIWLIRGDRRIILILALLVSLELFSIIAMGDTNVLQFPFLLLGWVLWKKQWQASAVMMGLAITIKQVAWVYMLFYLILILRETGMKRFLQTLGISGSIFLIFNLPFAALNPDLWASSMASIINAPLFPMGVGTVSFVTSGLLPIKNSLLFDASALAVLIAGLVWYYHNCRKYPYAGPGLAILPFFFSWRSLWGYFYFADFIILACILIYEYSPQMEQMKLQITNWK